MFFNQYFGNYLLEKKILKPEELRLAMEKRKSVKVKLGVLAIDSGFMNAAQVNRIHKLQAVRDRKFGELAMEEGYLTEAQLSELLAEQKKSNILIGQVLIEKGLFTFEKYEEMLFQYRRESSLTDDEFQALRSDDVKKVAAIFIKALPVKNIGIIHQYFELFIRNLIRFVDDEIRVEAAAEAGAYPFGYLITQRMEGKYGFFSGISAPEPILARFASVYAEQDWNTVNDLAEDALEEFLNCQNALFISNLSNKDANWELSLPEVKKGGILKPAGKLYVIPCHLSFGRIDFIFADERPDIQAK
jgi:hypothetical protein